MNYVGCNHGQNHQRNGHQVHRKTVFAERAEKARTYLQANSENKEYQAKIFEKRQNLRRNAQSEVAERNANKQNPCGA